MMLLEKQPIRSGDPNLNDKKPKHRLRKRRNRPAPWARGREGEPRGRRPEGRAAVPQNVREVRALIKAAENESPLDSDTARRWRRKGTEEKSEEEKEQKR